MLQYNFLEQRVAFNVSYNFFFQINAVSSLGVHLNIAWRFFLSLSETIRARFGLYYLY